LAIFKRYLILRVAVNAAKQALTPALSRMRERGIREKPQK
jgi:hypothetical protein